MVNILTVKLLAAYKNIGNPRGVSSKGVILNLSVSFTPPNRVCPCFAGLTLAPPLNRGR